jgi:hypothetical protein
MYVLSLSYTKALVIEELKNRLAAISSTAIAYLIKVRDH